MNKLGRTSPGQGNEVKCKEDPDCFLSLLKRAYEQVATIGTFSKLLPNDTLSTRNVNNSRISYRWVIPLFRIIIISTVNIIWYRDWTICENVAERASAKLSNIAERCLSKTQWLSYRGTWPPWHELKCFSNVCCPDRVVARDSGRARRALQSSFFRRRPLASFFRPLRARGN